MNSNPLERYQKIRKTITAIASSAESLMDYLIVQGQGDVAPQVAQIVAHTAVSLTHQTLQALEQGKSPNLAQRSHSSEPMIDCKVGCSWCCYLHVPVSQPEVQTIVNYLDQHLSAEERSRLRERVERTAQRLKTVNSRYRLARKIPCAFLKNNRCTIHPVRPAACRDHHSTNVAACQASFEKGQWMTPSHDKHDLVANSATMAIAQACTTLGFDGAFGELHAEVLAAFNAETNLADEADWDPWEVPEELDDAVLPTVLLETEPAPDPSLGAPSPESSAVPPPAEPSALDPQTGPERSLLRELAHDSISEAVPPEVSPADWVGTGFHQEESDRLSLFHKPLSAYFVDGVGDELSTSMGELGSSVPKGSVPQKLGSHTDSEEDLDLDDMDLEGLIQEVMAEVSQESEERGDRGAPPNQTEGVTETWEDGDDNGDSSFWRG